MSDVDNRLIYSGMSVASQHAVLAKNDEKLSAQLELLAEQNKMMIEQNKKIIAQNETIIDLF